MLFGYLEEGDQWRANFPVVLLLGSTSRWLHPLIRWIKSRAFYILVSKGKRYQVLEVFSTGTRLDGDHCCFCCCNCCCGRFFLFLSLSWQSLVHCLVLLFHLISVWSDLKDSLWGVCSFDWRKTKREHYFQGLLWDHFRITRWVDLMYFIW